MPTGEEMTTSNAYIDDSPVAGKGVFAFTKREEGDLIVSLVPKASAISTKSLATTCANCFALADGSASIRSDGNNPKMSACRKCRTTYYCGEECQKEHWRTIHKRDCKLYVEMARSMPRGNRLEQGVRLVISMIHMHANREGDPFEDLHAPLEQIVAQNSDRAQFMELSANTLDRHMPPPFGLRIIKKSFARFFVNTLSVTTAIFDTVGQFVDPFISKINHSCDPNAFVVFSGRQMCLRALKPIEKDEEIFITYIPPELPFYYRQHELSHFFYFTCKCKKCEHGPTLIEDQFSKNTAGKPKDFEIRKVFDISDMANPLRPPHPYYVGDATHEQMLGRVQEFGFDCLVDLKRATSISEAMGILQEGLNACLTTDVWPDYRQPLPQIYEAMYINYLHAGQWNWTFITGIKMWAFVNRVIYPQPWHPLRQQHRIRMLKLCMHLMGDQTSDAAQRLTARRVDFNMIAQHTIRLIWKYIGMSHGVNNPMYNEMKEIVRELRQGIGKGDSDLARMARDFNNVSNEEFLKKHEEKYRSSMEEQQKLLADDFGMVKKNTPITEVDPNLVVLD